MSKVRTKKVVRKLREDFCSSGAPFRLAPALNITGVEKVLGPDFQKILGKILSLA